MAKDGKTLNWAEIEAEYRAGQLSNVQIAKNHHLSEGAIRKRAKLHGWTRGDLAQKVQQAIKTGLVRDGVDRTEARTEQEIVEAAAARGIEVIRQHRLHLGGLQRISSHLASDLERFILGELKAPPAWLREESVTEAFHRLAQASSKWIPLERKAFSLDEKADKNKDINKLTDGQLQSRIADLLRRRGAAGTAGGAEPAMGAGAATG